MGRKSAARRVDAGLDVLPGPPPEIPLPPVESWPQPGPPPPDALAITVPRAPDGSDLVWVTTVDKDHGQDVCEGDVLVTVVTRAGSPLALTAPAPGAVAAVLREQGQNLAVGRVLCLLVPEPPSTFARPHGGLTPEQVRVWEFLDPLCRRETSARSLRCRLAELWAPPPGPTVAGPRAGGSWPAPGPPLPPEVPSGEGWLQHRRTLVADDAGPPGPLRAVDIFAFGGGALTLVPGAERRLPPFALLLSPAPLRTVGDPFPTAGATPRAHGAPWLVVLTPDLRARAVDEPLQEWPAVTVSWQGPDGGNALTLTGGGADLADLLRRSVGAGR